MIGAPLAPATLPRESSRTKDRSRSKSPFRSFRWRKSPKSPATMPSSASDDESNFDRAAERPSPAAGDEGLFEGLLVRKHEWESTTKKASNRSWDKLYAVLRRGQLYFYKDQKSYRTASDALYRGEAPVDVRGGDVEVAADYTKKKHVFRVKLCSGGEYLFQAKDDEEMSQWVGRINTQLETEGSGGPSRSQTLPAPGDRKDEPKKRGFFTLKKN